MIKMSFENELASNMRSELQKQASTNDLNDLGKAGECLHSALNILEEAGLQARANDILNLLKKIADNGEKTKESVKQPTIQQLMQAGITQKDIQEFAKGSPIAKAKFNLALRRLGLAEHQIGKLLGMNNVMSEADAKDILNPNRSFGKMWDWMKDPAQPTEGSGSKLEFKSLAEKALSYKKEVENLKNHGTVFNLADDNLAKKKHLTTSDMDEDFADILNSPSFDIDASDDELMGISVKDDMLEVSDQEGMSDFEDEKD